MQRMRSNGMINVIATEKLLIFGSPFVMREFNSLDLSNKVMKSPPSESEVDDWFAIYDHLMRTLLDKHAPMTSVHTRRRQAAPWYDEDCRVAKVSLRKLEKRHRRLQTADTLNAWRRQSHVVRSLFQLKYSTYRSNAVKECRGDCRALWTKINHLLRRQTTSKSTLNVDVLANYFRTKIDIIR